MIRINVKGVNLDKFIKNESQNYTLKNIERKSHKEVEFDINRINFKKLVAKCNKMCYNYNICRYSGIDKIINSMLTHFAFWFGILFFIALTILSQNYILKIDIYGLERLKTEDIEEVLYQNGVMVGKKIGSQEDYEDIEKILKDKFSDSISQISIANKGSYLIINIKENILGTSNNQNDTCDIIANCDGVIESIDTIQGTPLKKDGDSFKKGDILVKGEFLSINEEVKKCKAIANISYIEYESITINFYEEEYVLERTGESWIKNEISFLGIKSKKNKDCEYVYYEEDIKTSYLFKNFFLPIELVTKTYYNMEFVQRKRDFESEKDRIIAENEKILRDNYYDRNIRDIYSNIVKIDGGYMIVSTIQILNIV